MPYPIPPWVAKDNDPAGKFATGMHLGAQIQQAHESMVQQSQETEMRLQIAQQHEERDFQFKQQQAAVAQAQHQQQFELQQQQLMMAKQKNDLQVKQAADEYGAQQEYSRRIAAGEDASKVMMDLYPKLFTSATGLSGLMKAMGKNAALPPRFAVGHDRGRSYPYVWNPNTGSVHPFAQAQMGKVPQIDLEQARDLRKDRDALKKSEFFDPGKIGDTYRKNDPEGYKKAQEQLDTINKKIRQHLQGGGQQDSDAYGYWDPKQGKVVPYGNEDEEEARDIQFDEEN